MKNEEKVNKGMGIEENRMNESERKEHVKQHFEHEATEFDERIVKIIPWYKQMLSSLVGVLPFDAAAPIKIVDLGCGTGTVTYTVKQAFPHASVLCVDLAETMIELAQKKLAMFHDITFRCADFESVMFDEKYDAIVSSYALHHIEDDAGKQRMYKKIFDALVPGGVFYNVDCVCAPSAHLHEAYMAAWKVFMRQSLTDKEIDDEIIPRYYCEDRPATIMQHLMWLREVGFTDVDVIFKSYGGALYGGRK